MSGPAAHDGPSSLPDVFQSHGHMSGAPAEVVQRETVPGRPMRERVQQRFRVTTGLDDFRPTALAESAPLQQSFAAGVTTTLSETASQQPSAPQALARYPVDYDSPRLVANLASGRPESLEKVGLLTRQQAPAH